MSFNAWAATIWIWFWVTLVATGALAQGMANSRTLGNTPGVTEASDWVTSAIVVGAVEAFLVITFWLVAGAGWI